MTDRLTVMATEKPHPNKPEPLKLGVIMELAGFVFSFGVSLIIPVVVFILGGVALDKRYQVAPLFVSIGAILSILSVSFITYKEIKHLLKKL